AEASPDPAHLPVDRGRNGALSEASPRLANRFTTELRSGAISEVGAPMAEITLKAVSGRTTGTGPSKRIRAEGQVPGVVYGLGSDPVSVTVDWRPLREVLTTDAGLNVLIDLDVDGDVSLCMVKELQRHPIKGNVLHLDFLRVSR